jgi:very-short-patch-repair endonuclease
VVRYSNDEVLRDPNGVINNLEKIIHARESFPPDKGD